MPSPTATHAWRRRSAASSRARTPSRHASCERSIAILIRALAKGQFAWKTASGRELALYALERAARKDAADARVAWVKWRARLPQADRDYGNLRIAWHAARQLDPAANQWFKDVTGVALTPEQQAWRVRAALRVAAWSDVQAAIDALPESDRQEPVWRYWRARALAARDADDEARALFATLADGTDYYALLAAEALGRGGARLAALSNAAAPVDPVALASFGARPDVQRAVLLARFDLRLESLREWSYAIRGLDDSALLLAAQFARNAGLYDRAIFTAERIASSADFGLRYMTPFRAQFEAAAREQGLDCELLYGIARQESRFVADIVSGAGAVGLMQLMPGTARWVAKRMATADYSPARIADVRVEHAVRRVLFQVLAGSAGEPAGARGGGLQCRSVPRAGVATVGRAARRRDLGRDDSIQRDTRLREAGAGEHNALHARARSSVRVVDAAPRRRDAARRRQRRDHRAMSGVGPRLERRGERRKRGGPMIGMGA